MSDEKALIHPLRRLQRSYYKSKIVRMEDELRRLLNKESASIVPDRKSECDIKYLENEFLQMNEKYVSPTY